MPRRRVGAPAPALLAAIAAAAQAAAAPAAAPAPDTHRNETDNSNTDDPPAPWRTSRAKKLLHDDILAGRTDNMTGTQVFCTRAVFQRCRVENFASNFCDLRKALCARKESANAGRVACLHDKQILAQHRSQTTFHCNGSNVQRHLRHDVQKGHTAGKTPTQVVALRPAVCNVPGSSTGQFRNHLCHERRRHERMMHNEVCRDRIRFLTAEVNPNDTTNNG